MKALRKTTSSQHRLLRIRLDQDLPECGRECYEDPFFSFEQKLSTRTSPLPSGM